MDIIKIALIGGAGYLAYRAYTDGLFTAAPASASAGTPASSGTPAATPASTPASNPPAAAPPVWVTTIDTSGLVVAPDINHSLTGWVGKIWGNPNGAQALARIRLSIIVPDGRIFDQSGQEISSQLQSQGVNLTALRNAFYSAPRGDVPSVSPGFAAQYPDLLTPGGGLSGLGLRVRGRRSRPGFVPRGIPQNYLRAGTPMVFARRGVA